MDTLDAIRNRRAVKHFDPSHRLTDTETETLISLTLLSPTAFNVQHWRFVVVQDPALRKEIRKVAWDQAQVTDASLLVVLCADLKAWQKEPERYWRTAPQEVRDFLIPTIDNYYRDNSEAERDEAICSCGIAAQTLMLTAKAIGYDSCPMDGFDFPAVAQLVRLPADHIVVMLVAIGRATQPARPRGGQLPLDEVVVTDRFPN
jgi:nitroreductase